MKSNPLLSAALQTRGIYRSFQLLLCITATVYIAAVAMAIYHKHRQHVAIDAMSKLGADITFDYQYDEKGGFVDRLPPGPVWLRTLCGDDIFAQPRSVTFPLGETPVPDEIASLLSGLDSLQELDTTAHSFTDGQIAQIARLRNLTILNLTGARISDSGVANLHAMSKLKVLSLRGTSATAKGIASLSSLSQLESLDLSYSAVHDDALLELAAFSNLKYLGLDHVTITDAGLRTLAGLKKLEWISLGDTTLGSQAVDALKKALPKLEITTGIGERL